MIKDIIIQNQFEHDFSGEMMYVYNYKINNSSIRMGSKPVKSETKVT